MKGIKSIVFAAAALIGVPAVMTSCSDWTDPKAENYYEAPSESYKQSLKEYFASPHKVTFGWFGSWSAAAKGNQLIGLPDSVDFVSLWLCWGNLTPAQQADLKAFQQRGSKAVMCWLATNIGENITPGYSGVPPLDAAQEFWGFTQDDIPSMIEAAKKYADAIADTCDKYNIDGFDMDIEATGTLIMGGAETRQVQNEFLRQLRKRFDESGRMLVIDIPGGAGWLHYYDYLDQDVVESVDYICWQTYELGHSGLDNFFDWVKQYKPDIFENVLRKSIITATFERANDKYLYPIQSTWQHSSGIPHAGQGAYHIEYDYPGSPDYPTVRAGIATQNPPIYQ